MERLSSICILVIGLLSTTSMADAPNEKVTIPLDQIWALDMPGTRDVRELEPDVYGDVVRTLSAEERDRRSESSLVNQIGSVLDYLAPWKTKVAAVGFAVSGTHIDALRNAHAVLVEGHMPQQSFSAGDEFSIIFFSHSYGSYVHIERVEQQGNVIKIWYRFVPHRTKEMTRHFALIPLPKLQAGELSVEINQLPLADNYAGTSVKYLPAAKVRQIVCQPFNFSVNHRQDE